MYKKFISIQPFIHQWLYKSVFFTKRLILRILIFKNKILFKVNQQKSEKEEHFFQLFLNKSHLTETFINDFFQLNTSLGV